jgi:hypothetical protein
VANKSQPFRVHHVARALKGAVAAGIKNPSVSVTLPNGTTIAIGAGGNAGDKARARGGGAAAGPGRSPAGRASRSPGR